MSWFRIRNNADLPIHVAISTAGVIQYCQNDVPARGGYAEFDVADLIWHDLTVVPSNGFNQINQKENNDWKIAEITLGVAGILVAGAAGIAFAIPSVMTSIGLAANIIICIAGALVAVGTGVVSITNFALHPATLDNLYAPDGYNFEVTGGSFDGHQDPKDNKWVITGYHPITVSWHNNKTNRQGTVTAPS